VAGVLAISLVCLLSIGDSGHRKYLVKQ